MDEYGIFTDEGCIEGGFYSFDEAASARTTRYPEEAAHVAVRCPEHQEQEREHCEECNAEEDES